MELVFTFQHVKGCMWYHKMEKDNKKDLEQYNEAWNKNIVGELMKHGIKKIWDGSYLKCRKSVHHLDDCWEGGKDKEGQ
jgi:hypothetical protein